MRVSKVGEKIEIAFDGRELFRTAAGGCSSAAVTTAATTVPATELSALASPAELVLRRLGRLDEVASLVALSCSSS